MLLLMGRELQLEEAMVSNNSQVTCSIGLICDGISMFSSFKVL